MDEENSEDYTDNTDLEEENSLKEAVYERIIEKMQTVVNEHEQILKELFFYKNGGDILELKVWLKKPNKLLRRFLEAESLKMVMLSKFSINKIEF